MRYYLAFVSVQLCCEASYNIFLAGITLMQLTLLPTMCIWAGLLPWSSAAVMPVFDHQLGAKPHTSQHLLTSRHHVLHTYQSSLLSVVPFQTPLATAELQLSTMANRGKK